MRTITRLSLFAVLSAFAVMPWLSLAPPIEAAGQGTTTVCVTKDRE